MDNLAIHFLHDDEQLVTQEAVNKLVFNNTGANDEAQLEALAEHANTEYEDVCKRKTHFQIYPGRCMGNHNIPGRCDGGCGKRECKVSIFCYT